MKTLEEILQEMGCKKPFLKEVEVDSDGYRQPFTVKGSETYSKLIKILYAVEDVVEALDDIVNEMY